MKCENYMVVYKRKWISLQRRLFYNTHSPKYVKMHKIMIITWHWIHTESFPKHELSQTTNNAIVFFVGFWARKKGKKKKNWARSSLDCIFACLWVQASSVCNADRSKWASSSTTMITCCQRRCFFFVQSWLNRVMQTEKKWLISTSLCHVNIYTFDSNTLGEWMICVNCMKFNSCFAFKCTTLKPDIYLKFSGWNTTRWIECNSSDFFFWIFSFWSCDRSNDWMCPVLLVIMHHLLKLKKKTIWILTNKTAKSCDISPRLAN